MRIGSISENKKLEKRIAITPDIAKRYINLGFEVRLIKNYGLHLGFNDNLYADFGAKIFDDEKNLIDNSDLIIQLNLPDDQKNTASNTFAHFLLISNPNSLII